MAACDDFKERLLYVSESDAAQPRALPVTPTQLERLAALDDGAWQSLYDEYFLKLRNFAYGRCGDLGEAEDIASETFAGAVRGIGSYRDRGAPLAAWLFRIARNVTADHLRRRKRRPEAPLMEGREAPMTDFSRIEDRDEMLRGLQHLTEEQQTLIALRFFADCSLEESAKAMNKNIGAVKGLQQRALASLKRSLSSNGGKR